MYYDVLHDFQWKFLIHMTKERVVIVPGNGRGDVEHSNWYGWLKNKLLEVSLPEDDTFSLQLFVINLKPSAHHLPRLALLFAGGVIFVYLM